MVSQIEKGTILDWEIGWMSRLRPVKTGQNMLIPRFHRDSHESLVRILFILFPAGLLLARACSVPVGPRSGGRLATTLVAHELLMTCSQLVYA